MKKNWFSYVGLLACLLLLPVMATASMQSAQPLALEERHELDLAAGEEKWLSFETIDEPAFYNIDVKNVDINTPSVVKSEMLAVLVDGDGEALGQLELEKEEKDTLSFKLETSEAYYLKVYMDSNNSEAAGSFQVTISTAPDAAGEASVTAFELALGEAVTCTLDGHGDVDYLAFTTTREPSFYNIDVKNINVNTPSVVKSGMLAALVDEDGEVLGQLELGMEKQQSLSFKLAPETTYYLRVMMDQNNTKALGEYRVLVSDKQDEAGETAEEALELVPDVKHTFSLDGTGDVDCFVITPSDERAYYNIQVKNVDIHVPSVIKSALLAALYDSDGEVLEQVELKTEESALISKQLTPGETYYLKVFMDVNNLTATGSYQVTVAVTPDEAGDTQADALALAMDETLTCSLDGYGDVDMYTFTTDESMSFYNVDIARVDIPGINVVSSELLAEMVDEDGEVLQLTEIESEQTRTLSVKLSPDTVYYVRVKMDKNHTVAMGEYRVTLRQVADDIGDTQEEAKEIVIGTLDGGALDGTGDIDWFAFVGTAEDGMCTVEVENIDILTDSWYSGALETTIWDESGNRIERITGYEGASRVSFNAQANAQYFLRVCMTEGMPQSTGQYRIRICMQPDHFPKAEWEIRQQAGCEEDGQQVKICEVCREVAVSEVIPATGHNPGEWEEREEVTCTEDGLREKRCLNCYETLEEETIPALGHEFGEFVVTREATKEAEGEEQRTCTRCGEVESRPIEKLPKNFFERIFG